MLEICLVTLHVHLHFQDLDIFGRYVVISVLTAVVFFFFKRYLLCFFYYNHSMLEDVKCKFFSSRKTKMARNRCLNIEVFST